MCFDNCSTRSSERVVPSEKPGKNDSSRPATISAYIVLQALTELLLMFMIRTRCISFYGTGDCNFTTRGDFSFLFCCPSFSMDLRSKGGNKWSLLAVYASAAPSDSG
jgi:hypothetical protein